MNRQRTGERIATSAILGYILAACLATHPKAAMAQMDMSGHAMETVNQTPAEDLPAPRKMTGIGNVHMQITATPEAQVWFDQGLNLLQDYWDYESARAFEQSVRVDPQCAMCYWGLYEAQSFYHSTTKGYAAQSLAKAVYLKDRVTDRERLYIEASDARENASKNPRPGSPATEELEIWRKIVKQYPHDTQARIFMAEMVDRKEALAILEAILKDEPENSAANHQYVHDLEASEHPEKALQSAEILPTLAPSSGHMVHMPGHILFRVGDYARAEQAFTASMEVDERYLREQHVDPDNDWNYVHNLMYAIANLMEEGKLTDATALSMKLNGARGKLESTLYTYSTRDAVSRLNPRLPVALRTADWTKVIELLDAGKAPAGRPNLDFLARQLVGFAAGMRAVELRDIPSAEASSLRLDAKLWRMSQHLKEPAPNNASNNGPPNLPVMPDALLQPLLNSLSVMSLELHASLLAAEGKLSEAKRLFTMAAQQEKALGYREPPHYIRPVGETEGAALTAVGDWSGARVAYEEALVERPKSGFALYGIARASEKSGDLQAAAKEYSDFLAAWKNADSALPELTHAKTYLAERRVSAAGTTPPDRASRN